MPKAKLIQTAQGERQKLAEVLPLDAPFTVVVHPSNVCNFKCFYCAHSNKPSDYKKTFLDLSLFQKCVDDIAASNKKLKLLAFIGLGEPLLHPDIAEMVHYAKNKQIAETVRIISNAALLTPETGDKLIAAGLDSIKISIEGLSDKQYFETTGNKIAFQTIVE
jgi:MoaA/NifB/PqqE/SkfB family radical SAM enzyme